MGSEKAKKSWQRERLIDKRDRKRDELKSLEQAKPTLERAREIYEDDISKKEELIDAASEKFGGRIPEEQTKYSEFFGELKKLENAYISNIYRDMLLIWPSFRDEHEQELEKDLAEIEAEIERFEQE